MGIQASKPGCVRLSIVCTLGWWNLGVGPVTAQTLIANDDEYGIPFGEPLVIEAFGVLDNDTLDGETAGENGATADLVANVSHGVLALASDGSFSYSPGSTFDGADQFIYRAVFGAVSAQAIVTLTACNGGPQIFDCWNEAAYRAKAADFGYFSFEEGFENDSAWGIARSPITAGSVSSQGVEWRSNHPDPPASNEITTGPGPARTGNWGLFDAEHGYATGTSVECDIDDPPLHCLFHDGFTGVREPGRGALHGVGGYITGTHGANVALSIDGAAPIGGGTITGGAHRFFGVIDTGPTGFNRFEFRELDGKIGQALYIFGDDFTLLTTDPTPVGEARIAETSVFFAGARPNPSDGNTTLRFTLDVRSHARLSIHDPLGRRVIELADEVRSAGTYTVRWDGRDRQGNGVSAGIYFGRLIVRVGVVEEVQMRKIVVTR